MLEHSREIAERDARLSDAEAQLDGVLDRLARGRHVAKRIDGLFEADRGLSMGRAGGRAGAGLSEVTGRRVPAFAGVVVTSEGERVGCEVPAVERLERPRRRLMQSPAIG